MIYAYARSSGKHLLDIYFAAKVALLRAMGIVDFPVPPNHNLRTTSSATLRHYYESGLTTFLPIAAAAMGEGVKLRENIRILDFGCGAGRQLLHFTRQFPQPSYSACDVNDDAIKFIRSAYPQVDAYANSFDPPLKFAASHFDMIYSVSIFSHLSPQDRDIWLAELFRVLKPGGLCLPSVNGLHSLRRAHAKGVRRQMTEQQLQDQGYLFDSNAREFQMEKQREEQTRFGARVLGITRIYGETYYSREFFAGVASCAGFQCLRILDGIVDQLQDLVVLRKP